MKPVAVFIILVYISLLLESTWCIHCNSLFLHIDPAPPLVCWLALRTDPFRGGISVLVAGLLASLFSSLPFFLFPLAYLVAFFTVYLVRINVLEMSKFRAYLMTGFISVEIVFILLAGSGNPELLWPWEMVQAILNIAIAPPTFWVCEKCLRRFDEILARLRHEK